MDHDIDTEQLILLVQERPPLWDKSREDYKSRACTTECWRDVCSQTNPDFENLSESDKNKYGKLIANKWRNIKDQYIKSVKKRKGRNYIYHKQLSFLKISLEMRETESVFEVDSEKSPKRLNEAMEDSDHMEKSSEVDEVSATKMSIKMAPKRRKVDMKREFLKHLAAGENRHLSFFKGLLPSLEGFTDDEILQFQAGVISVIQNIKKTRSLQSHDLPHNPPHQGPYTADGKNLSLSGLQRSEQSSPHTSYFLPQFTYNTVESPVPSEDSDLSFTDD